jgi:cytochrome c
MKKTLSLFGATLVAATLLSAQDAKTAAKAGDAEKGKETFEQCGACHSIVKDEKKMGPSLHGVFKKAKLNNGKKPTEATIKEIINKGGNGMPAYEDLLTEEERANVIAYLKTL